MDKSAYISKDGLYRYCLTRIWDREKPFVCFIGLNPSTADAENDDQTMRKEINYADSWGYGGLYKANLFAFRTKEPKVMKKAIDPIGPENDFWITAAVSLCDLVLFAWGNDGLFMDRGIQVVDMIKAERKVYCLTKTKLGQPGHTLYLKKDLKPIEF